MKYTLHQVQDCFIEQGGITAKPKNVMAFNSPWILDEACVMIKDHVYRKE